ncbi:hypothetical protein BaRGS_00037211, partial [Batillaria attramentaria]
VDMIAAGKQEVQLWGSTIKQETFAEYNSRFTSGFFVPLFNCYVLHVADLKRQLNSVDGLPITSKIQTPYIPVG